MWTARDIGFDLRYEDTDAPVATVDTLTPDGQLTIMAEVEIDGRLMRLRGLHIQGSGANRLGIAKLRASLGSRSKCWRRSMSSKLRAQLERLGPVRDVDRVASGSPVDLVLRPAEGVARVRTIDATLVLAKRGLGLLKAKRTIEEMLTAGHAVVRLPVVEDVGAVSSELSAAGVAARRIGREPVDLKALRQRLGVTQEQFALRYGLEIAAVQNWEQGRCEPDRATQSYLHLIAALPDEAARALEVELV